MGKKKTVDLPPRVDPETGEVMRVSIEGEAPFVEAVAKAMTWERNGRPVPELLSVRLTPDELRDLGSDLAGVLEEIQNQTMREESVPDVEKAADGAAVVHGS